MLVVELDKVVRDSYPALRARALRLTQDWDRAHDLVQNTLERFLSRSPADLPRDKVLPWLFIVMRHLFVDGIRTPAARWEPLRDGEPPQEPQAEMDSFEGEPLWSKVRLDDAHAVLHALPDAMRYPYEMHVVAKLSYREIAKILHIEVPTVGSRIHRARRYLRAILMNKGVPDQVLDAAIGPASTLLAKNAVEYRY
jgi:RNA polymerase sigma-70 factor (ECF subfamily)